MPTTSSVACARVLHPIVHGILVTLPGPLLTFPHTVPCSLAESDPPQPTCRRGCPWMPPLAPSHLKHLSAAPPLLLALLTNACSCLFPSCENPAPTLFSSHSPYLIHFCLSLSAQIILPKPNTSCYFLYFTVTAQGPYWSSTLITPTS